MSRQEQVLEILMVEKKLSDEKIAEQIRTSVKNIQTSVCWINFNKKKFKEFSIIRHGSKKNYIRELIKEESDENDLIDSADEDGKKALRKLDARRKKVKISINTRQGQNNRIRLVQNILSQNLNLSIEAQKLLQ